MLTCPRKCAVELELGRNRAASANMESASFHGIRAVFFDFMGTCLDWYTNTIQTLPNRIDLKTRSNLAIAWRELFFEDIRTRFEQGLPQEDIDSTHARLLKALLENKFADVCLSLREQDQAVRAWHHMTAWPDVPPALSRLREEYEVFVLANGTTRLQLDLARSSDLRFDMLLSSELLRVTKPDPEMYKKALILVGVEAQESLMVAAHAYDLRAAKKVGMQTVYIRRWTEDTMEDMAQVQKDVNMFIGGVVPGSEDTEPADGQLTDLADILCGRAKDPA